AGPVLADPQDQRDIPDAELGSDVEGVEQPGTDRVGEQAQQGGHPFRVGRTRQPGTRGGDPLEIDRMVVAGLAHARLRYPATTLPTDNRAGTRTSFPPDVAGGIRLPARRKGTS